MYLCYIPVPTKLQLVIYMFRNSLTKNEIQTKHRNFYQYFVHSYIQTYKYYVYFKLYICF
jgi:hypothetical protein